VRSWHARQNPDFRSFQQDELSFINVTQSPTSSFTMTAKPEYSAFVRVEKGGMSSEANVGARRTPATEANGDLFSGCQSALELLLTQRGDASREVDRLLAEKPKSLGLHCLRLALIVRADDSGARSTAEESIALIEAESPDLSAHAHHHASAARAWLEGNPALAVLRYDAIVTEWPHDILALAIAHAVDFRFGRRSAMRERFARVLRKWDAAIAGYASLLAMLAFALEESGQYRRAEKVARRSLSLEPQNPYAIHVITHVMEMQGRAREGLAFLAETEPVWSVNTGLSVHLAWHRALFELDLDPRLALATYDWRIANARNADLSALTDASALLWRLQLGNAQVKERWQRLADRWKMQALDGVRPFYIVHAMMAFAAAGRDAAAACLLESLHHRLGNGDGFKPLPEETLAYPFCRALIAYVRGDYATCVAWLTRVRHIADRCGGSLAQCDLIHLTFTEAALRARSAPLARALVNERTAHRPSSRLNRLLAQRLGTILPAAA
jgi:hypothetical protein